MSLSPSRSGANEVGQTKLKIDGNVSGLQAQSASASAAAGLWYWIRFTPALVVWPAWLFLMCKGAHWSAVFEYWPASVAMVLGSFVAGSTPLGGGVVAFPVAVLVLEFTAEESRDASALVQSVGMTAASFFLLLVKRDTLVPEIIFPSVVFGGLGVIVGLAIEVDSYAINFTFTLSVLLFMFVYLYTNVYVLPRRAAAAEVKAKATVDAKPRGADLRLEAAETGSPRGGRSPAPPASLTAASQNATATPRARAAGAAAPAKGAGARDALACALLVTSALVGGFITSKVGSGSDMAVFVFGIYGWNACYPERQYSDVHFTASSVVVMASMSVLLSVVRSLESGFTDKVVRCWGAMAFVVVLGAPLGSIVLRPSMVPALRMLFYAMAVVQFVMFAILKIGADAASWVIIASGVTAVLAMLGGHYLRSSRRAAVSVAAAD